MELEMKRSIAKKARRIRLGFETLEPRMLMAGLVASLDRSTKTVRVVGTDVADIVSITQNDAMNKLSIAFGQSGDVTQQFPSNQVNKVIVQLGQGDDQFFFQSIRDVWNRKDFQLDLGPGDDTGKVLWAEDGGTARADMNLSLNGGDGSDAFATRVGRIGFANKTNVEVDMGRGDDGFVVQLRNPDSAREKHSVSAKGGDGNDSLEFYASGTLARYSVVSVNFDGQEGDDELTVENNGSVDGDLSETLDGGPGDDSISFVGSGTGKGRLRLSAHGNSGDDTLVVDVRSSKSRPIAADVTVDGGTGDDMSFLPTTLRPRNVEDNKLLTVQNRPTLLESFDPVLPTQILRSENRTVEYWTKGWSPPDAPVVVLLSGAGTSIDSWSAIVPGLNSVGQVISVNKPGYGRTELPGKDPYNVTLIEDVRRVVAKVSPGRQVILVGHSIGGPYASLYARMYPTEVAGVIFADSTEQVRVEPKAFTLTSPSARVYPPGIVAEYASLGQSINAPLDSTSFPSIPVIALFAELSPEALPYAQQYADLGLSSPLQIVPNAGHFLHVDQPQVVIGAIKDMVRKTEISGILADVSAKYGVPGLVASIVVGQQTLSGSAGVRVARTSSSVQIDDRFGVGSNTKAMTATLAGILVDRGLIRWDTTLVQAFPELRSSMLQGYSNVTLEQLLQHRGGIIADEDASAHLISKVAAYTGPASQSRLSLLPEILKEPLPGPVGEFRYSNAGYAAAAAMLERITRVPYEQLMQRFLFNPLGMTSATFDPPVSNPLNPKQPIGHLPDGTPAPGDRPPADYLGDVLRPAGADLRMNIADWSKFARIHLGGSVNGKRLVSPTTLDRLQTPVPIADDPLTQGYAMGWAVYNASAVGLNSRLGRVLSHLGSDGVWLAEIAAFPDVDFSIQILANATVDKHGNSLSERTFEEIKQRLFHRFAPRLAT
jgi:CubicO group peptidase (beta-lactamase class C family)/pimeloyl-ACP methyl ester carboxylesterase